MSFPHSHVLCIDSLFIFSLAVWTCICFCYETKWKKMLELHCCIQMWHPHCTECSLSVCRGCQNHPALPRLCLCRCCFIFFCWFALSSRQAPLTSPLQLCEHCQQQSLNLSQSQSLKLTPQYHMYLAIKCALSHLSAGKLTWLITASWDFGGEFLREWGIMYQVRFVRRLLEWMAGKTVQSPICVIA